MSFVPRRLRCVLLAALVLGAATVAAARPPLQAPPTATLAADLAVLTRPDMEGRGSGTAGAERAARQIADWLAAAGLAPGGDAGTFFQPFVVSTSTRLASRGALEVVAPAPRGFAPERDWIPHGGSLDGEVAGEVVFAGYGIVAPEASHDDYAGLDVAGKIALILDGGPPHLAGQRPSQTEKLLAARRRGIRAALVVADALPGLDATGTSVGIVSATATPAVADALLAPARRTAAQLARAIADARSPASFATGSRARLHVALRRTDQRAANVVGVLPGTDPVLAREAVVVGAHYDHLGRVGGDVHPGADDNASGTAVVVGLARAFAAAGGAPRTLVFALFAGEELGLLGSRYHVGRPTVPLARTVAMLNFDMVGRLRDGRLSVGGVDSGSGLRDVVSDAARGTGLDLGLRGQPHGPSDHASFYRAGAPVLFFHTGRHPDYHRPTDTADRIDADGMARVAALGVRVLERLAGDGPRPVYAVVAPPPNGQSRTAFLGVGADPRARDGLRLASVQSGSAAARAGIREGDVILRLAGVPVSSLDELRAVLAARRPGDTVDLVYLRDGRARAAAATLDARP
jgi:hypothetical protein